MPVTTQYLSLPGEGFNYYFAKGNYTFKVITNGKSEEGKNFDININGQIQNMATTALQLTN
ncbi:MAG: hypothetical protein HRU38_19900 [Saccharospirillaceae bacterium]|nr:hypothetical protein [Pseudomonadales bacterium]NRB80897.1 hypothetical protein [Saccharospirillaceae bacterium]